MEDKEFMELLQYGLTEGRKEREWEERLPALQHTYETIENIYNRMLNCSSTSGRNNNYETILWLLRHNPEMNEYWEHRPNEFKIVNRIRHIKKFSVKKYSISIVQPKKQEKEEYAYIVLLNKDIIKVGKTNNLNRRMSELRSQYDRVILLKDFKFNDTEDAFIMEVLLHKYYKAKYPEAEFLPQDRFKGAGLDNDDLEIMEQMAEKVRTEKWF